MSHHDDPIDAVHREVGQQVIPAGEGTTVRLRRAYEAPVEDVWEACTDRERLGRWFLPVSGELRPGGAYQLKDNARGEILACEPPRLLRVTWVYGEEATDRDVSEVEVRLTPGEGDGVTILELTHTAVVDPAFWARFGPGATGVGWDGGLFSLAEHLAGRQLAAEEWQRTPEGREFNRRSSQAWGVAHADAGGAADAVSRAVAETTAFYVPE